MPPRKPKSVTIFTVTITRKEPRETLDTVNDIRFRFADYNLAADFIRGLPAHLDHQLSHDITHTDVPYCLSSLEVWMPS